MSALAQPTSPCPISCGTMYYLHQMQNIWQQMSKPFIWIHQWTNWNTCKSQSSWFPKRLLKHTICKLLHTMGSYMSKSTRAFMVSPRQEFLQTSSWPSISQKWILPRSATHAWIVDTCLPSNSVYLVVDDFSPKYMGKQQTDHLLSALHKSYEVSINWKGALYCGFTLQWDYNVWMLNISMPNYIKAMLTKFQHPMPQCPQHAPHHCNPLQYGVKIQFTAPHDDSLAMPPPWVKHCQKLLYYGHAVDSTLLIALSAIALEQCNATENNEKAVHQLLDYCATNPNAVMQFYASDMQLCIHSNASYLNEPQACSQARGHFYLSNKVPKTDILNGAILNPTGILKVSVSSTAESEVGALFVNGKKAPSSKQC